MRAAAPVRCPDPPPRSPRSLELLQVPCPATFRPLVDLGRDEPVELTDDVEEKSGIRGADSMEEHIKRPLRARFNLWSRGFELVLVEPLDGSRHVAWTQRNWEWCFIWWIGNMEARLDALMRRELRRLAAVLNPATNPKDSTAASRERKPGDLVPAADLRDTMEACCDLWGLSRYMELRQMKLVPQKGDELEQVLRGLLSVVGRLCYDSRPSGGNAAALGLGTLWALLRAPLAVQLATDGVRALPEVCDALALVERKQKWLATAKRAALVNGGGVLACLTSCSERSREELAQSKERRALLESLSALAIPEINYAIFNVGYDHHHTTKLIQFLENLRVVAAGRGKNQRLEDPSRLPSEGLTTAKEMKNVEVAATAAGTAGARRNGGRKGTGSMRRRATAGKFDAKAVMQATAKAAAQLSAVHAAARKVVATGGDGKKPRATTTTSIRIAAAAAARAKKLRCVAKLVVPRPVLLSCVYVICLLAKRPAGRSVLSSLAKARNSLMETLTKLAADRPDEDTTLRAFVLAALWGVLAATPVGAREDIVVRASDSFNMLIRNAKNVDPAVSYCSLGALAMAIHGVRPIIVKFNVSHVVRLLLDQSKAHEIPETRECALSALAGLLRQQHPLAREVQKRVPAVLLLHLEKASLPPSVARQAAGALMVAPFTTGRWSDSELRKTLALQTALPATDLKEYVALALWGLARNQRNRRRLGTDVGALRGLLVLLPPMNVSDRLCEYLCVALWMLCCDEVNAATFAQAGGLHVFCQHLRYPKGAFHRCKLLSVGILRACYYYNRDVTSPILLNRELGPLLVDIVKDEKAPDKLHVLTLQFMEELMGEETHRKALIAYDGPHPVDRLLIYVLKGRSTLKHRFALEAIARRAQSRMRGRIIGALGAIGRIAQLGIGAGAEKSEHVSRSAMRALLNLSAEPRNQIMISRAYRDDLIEQIMASKREDLRWYSANVLYNLSRHPANAADMNKSKLQFQARAVAQARRGEAAADGAPSSRGGGSVVIPPGTASVESRSESFCPRNSQERGELGKQTQRAFFSWLDSTFLADPRHGSSPGSKASRRKRDVATPPPQARLPCARLTRCWHAVDSSLAYGKTLLDVPEAVDGTAGSPASDKRRPRSAPGVDFSSALLRPMSLMDLVPSLQPNLVVSEGGQNEQAYLNPGERGGRGSSGGGSNRRLAAASKFSRATSKSKSKSSPHGGATKSRIKSLAGSPITPTQTKGQGRRVKRQPVRKLFPGRTAEDALPAAHIGLASCVDRPGMATSRSAPVLSGARSPVPSHRSAKVLHQRGDGVVLSPSASEPQSSPNGRQAAPETPGGEARDRERRKLGEAGDLERFLQKRVSAVWRIPDPLTPSERRKSQIKDKAKAASGAMHVRSTGKFRMFQAIEDAAVAAGVTEGFRATNEREMRGKLTREDAVCNNQHNPGKCVLWEPRVLSVERHAPDIVDPAPTPREQPDSEQQDMKVANAAEDAAARSRWTFGKRSLKKEPAVDDEVHDESDEDHDHGQQQQQQQQRRRRRRQPECSENDARPNTVEEQGGTAVSITSRVVVNLGSDNKQRRFVFNDRDPVTNYLRRTIDDERAAARRAVTTPGKTRVSDNGSPPSTRHQHQEDGQEKREKRPVTPATPATLAASGGSGTISEHGCDGAGEAEKPVTSISGPPDGPLEGSTEGCVCGGVCAKDFMEGGAQFTRDRAIKELIRRSKGSYVEVTLAKFPHHPGCRQCEGLYEHFDLPDGTSVHFYCNEKQASEVPVPAAGPPKDPVELADAHMTGLPPLPKLLEPTEGTPPILPSYFFPESPPITVHIGPDGAFVNDKQRVPPPDPVQSPWTAHHQEPWPTVRWYVEHCMRGLPGSRMHWLCDTLLGPGDTSVGDSDDGAPPPTPCGGRPRYPVPKQDLKIGLFRNRRRECESHAFLDKPSIIAAALENDLRMFGDGNGLKRVERDAGVRERVAEVLRAHYAEIRNIFKYYCTPGAGHVFSITLNPFSDMARECNLISEADHDSLSMADLDTIFIEATYQHDQRSPRNLANSICRFEFVEAMVRIAKRKYCYHRNGSAEKKMKLDEALFALLDLHILPLAKRVRDGNDFREKIVYFQDVLSVLQKYLVHLKSVFDRFATVFRPRLGKVLQWADWSELMIMALAQTRSEGGEIGYIGGLTEREIKTAFTCSKMAFINEIENDVPEVMSFVDFLEGFVRLGWGMIIAPEVIAADRTALTGHFCEDPHCSCHTEGEGEPFERYFIVERLERLAPKFVALSRNRRMRRKESRNVNPNEVAHRGGGGGMRKKEDRPPEQRLDETWLFPTTVHVQIRFVLQRLRANQSINL